MVLTGYSRAMWKLIVNKSWSQKSRVRLPLNVTDDPYPQCSPHICIFWQQWRAGGWRWRADQRTRRTQSTKKKLDSKLHCNKNPIYVFPEKILRGLSPNFRIHVSVSDLYIQRIGPHIFLQQNIGRATKNVETGLRSRNSFSGNICFEFLVFCLCSVQPLTAAIPYFKIAIFVVQDLRSYSTLYLLESKEMGYEMQKIF